MDKWFTILMIGIVFGMFSPVIVMEYGKSECRIEAIKVNKSATEIKEICK
jgi:hypothetical protein